MGEQDVEVANQLLRSCTPSNADEAGNTKPALQTHVRGLHNCADECSDHYPSPRRARRSEPWQGASPAKQDFMNEGFRPGVGAHRPEVTSDQKTVMYEAIGCSRVQFSPPRSPSIANAGPPCKPSAQDDQVPHEVHSARGSAFAAPPRCELPFDNAESCSNERLVDATPPEDSLSVVSSGFATPAGSARSSEFASICAPSSYRSVAEGGFPYDSGRVAHAATFQGSFGFASSRQRRHRAYTAALDAFVPATCAHTARTPRPETKQKPPLDTDGVFSAARHGRFNKVEAALGAGFTTACQDAFGNTLFHIACQNGNKRLAKLAIRYGGDINAQNSKGNTGLHFLFAFGYSDLGEYFIEKGADEFIRNDLGNLPREGIK